MLRMPPAMSAPKRDNAQHGEGEVSLVANDPVDIKGDKATNEENAEGDEEGNGSAASSDVP